MDVLPDVLLRMDTCALKLAEHALLLLILYVETDTWMREKSATTEIITTMTDALPRAQWSNPILAKSLFPEESVSAACAETGMFNIQKSAMTGIQMMEICAVTSAKTKRLN